MKTIAIYAQSEQCGSRRRSGRGARSSLSRLAVSQTGISAGRNSMEWKSRRREVPQRLEPRWCDGALSEEEWLDRFDIVFGNISNTTNTTSLFLLYVSRCIIQSVSDLQYFIIPNTFVREIRKLFVIL